MEIIDQIKAIRRNKKISNEAMALNLGITQAAYTKLERNETKLTVDRLYKIAEILEVKVEDLLQVEPKTFQQNIYDNGSVTAVSSQQVERFSQENVAVYEKLLQSKDEQIILLKSLLEKT